MRRIGLLGGTFSPPHEGHLHAAATARELLKLDELWFLPDAQPPHKKLPVGTPNPEQRAEMTELLASRLDGASVCRIELELPPPSYTAHTVTVLKERFPEDEFTFIVGSDMLLTLERWYHPEIILKTVKIAALARHDADIGMLEACAENLRMKFGAVVTVLTADVREVSSTDLREALAKLPPDSTVFPEGLTREVGEYIRAHGLYKEAQT